MKYFLTILSITISSHLIAQLNTKHRATAEVIKIESRIPGLKLAITRCKPDSESSQFPVLFIHGASFPSALAFGFKMSGNSWMNYMAMNGYNTYALDFLGYGSSDRYPEMTSRSPAGKSLGQAEDVYLDIDKAVNFILEITGKEKVHLIAHSWGSTVAALYASLFPQKIDRLVLFAPITVRTDTAHYSSSGTMYELMTPEARVKGMVSLTPKGKVSMTEPEVLHSWGNAWLESDPLAKIFNDGFVRFPSGANNDILDLSHGMAYYNPAAIQSPTLIIRGEWDRYPNNSDAEQLFKSLENAPHKKYVVIEKGTHVMHLEKSRTKLYTEVINFLQTENKKQMKTKAQIAVIFEVIPLKNKKDDYLKIAAELRPELEKIGGFISIERFQSLADPDKILSLSFWANEEAVREWRNTELHRLAQYKGRNGIFKDYRLRVVSVIRDYGMFDRTEAPADSKAVHDNPTKN